jgi:hypothetical protein
MGIEKPTNIWQPYWGIKIQKQSYLELLVRFNSFNKLGLKKNHA